MAIKIDGTGYIGSANNIYTDGSGNVGIGTSSPGSKFHIANGAMYLADPNNAVIYSPGSQGKFYIRSGTSGSYIDCMIIDSSGRITKPYQPSIRLNGNASSVSIGSSVTVLTQFDVVHNTGMTYSSGRVTVPVAGVYAVSWQIYHYHTSHARTSLLKNGSRVSLCHSSNTALNDETRGATVYIQLSANDYLETARSEEHTSELQSH